MYDRIISKSIVNTESSFLWGPRQVGKSTALKKHFPDAHYIDLLSSDEFRKYISRPQTLEDELRLVPP